MADSGEWLVGEDGCLSVGQPTDSVTYHSTLNTILVVTKEPAVKVLDATSGSVLQSSNVSACGNDGVRCAYLASKEKVLLCDGHSVGLRRDLNGVLLLDTALQTPISKSEDVIRVELPLPEAKHLFKCVMSAELTGVAYVEDVLRELETGIDTAQQATKANHKVAKWATVCLRLPHCKLLSVCSNLVTELKRLHQHVPGLSVASTIIDRLMYLMPGCSVFETMPSSAGQFDRALMYSEGARRDTFSKWPHMNYKWALPDQMSQAGFYHQPSSTGDDRAMCFTCNVCLVCWEPTDEPWSEHERHSPQCPFVKGEYTQNVPMCVTYATEPAHLHGSIADRIECVSATSSDDYIATSTLHGNVVVWNMTRQLKQHIKFNIDPWEPIVAIKTGTQLAQYDDITLKLPSTSTANQSDAGDGCTTKQQECCSETLQPMASSDNMFVGIAEIIDVSGAWKKPMKMSSEVLDVPLEISQPQEMFPQRQPSQDILVSALCVLDSPDEGAIGATPLTVIASSGQPSPCLVSGVAIRRSAPTINNYQMSPVLMSDETQNKVQALNQVNQALNECTQPEIISHEASANSSETPGFPPDGADNPFVPYLLVHDITNAGSKSVSQKSYSKDCMGGNGKDAAPLPAGYHANKTGALYQAIQQAYPQYMLDVEDEPDVQIIGVTPPLHGSSEPDSSTSSATAETSLLLTDLGHTTPLLKGSDVPLMVPVGGSSGGEATAKQDLAMVATDNGAKDPDIEVNSLTQWGIGKPGHVIQCIELPQEYVDSSQYVSAIVPSLDGCHIVVATAPKCVNTKINVISQHEAGISSSADVESPPATSGGCILLYRVISEGSIVHLDETPIRMCPVDAVDDSVLSIVMLPPEIVQLSEEDDDDDFGDPMMTRGCSDDAIAGRGYGQGQFAVTTYKGDVKIFNLCDFKTLAWIVPPDGRVFVSTTYCTGIDRLCCCSREGYLHFYAVGPAKLHHQDSELDLHCPSVHAVTGGQAGKDDVDMTVSDQVSHTDDLLVRRPLTTEVLTTLVELTKFENLVPRFSATVPPCWSEMQQEQQQRRHPQHLHCHGEATQHTRTWRLQQDSSSWDEHVFELVLPRPCCVSHIDLKFSLHPLCITPPSIQITLLKQSSSTIGHAPIAEPVAQSAVPIVEVDAGIDFKVDSQPRASTTTTLTREFLERHSAEVVCGPVELANFVDLSGRGGLVTLTSPKLLRIKTKSFLLHMKALACERPPSPLQRDKAAKTEKKTKAGGTNSSNGEKLKVINVKKLDQLASSPTDGPTIGVDASGGGASPSKQKLESIRGCDWLQEISVTVRKNTKTNIPRDRLQRCLMVDDESFHHRLVALVCRQNDNVACTTSEEHRQKLAIDLLMWIVTIQMNDIRKDCQDQHRIVFTIQSSLKSMVRACFLQAGRTVAHRCAKLITLCIEFNKNATDPDTVPGFNFALLDALVDSLSLIPGAYSAGALFWYFTLLNRVKCMDANLTAQICTDILCHVAQQYNDKTNHWHSLLKARFGLYGCPLEPDLFDIDPPMHVKSNSSGNVSYAGAVNGGSGMAGCDEVDFQDLLSMTSSGGGEKLSGTNKMDQISRHICGLLEVEPLHYTCHATSDGTRIERLDTGSGISVVGQPTGTINFGDSVPTTAGAALASLSTAMASAEHQLHMLQQKQVQLLKLQQQKQKLEQKLAETSKSTTTASGGTGSVSVGTANMGGATSNFIPYSSELLPPTPKNTPFFMTPPVTPPNESYAHFYQNSAAVQMDLGKPPTGKTTGGGVTEGGSSKENGPTRLAMVWPQTQCLFHPAPAQVLVIERMHSGARRFVVLDFGKPVMLTDLVIPACNDLASLCIDSWVQSEEVDGQRLVVTTDIGYRSLVLNDLMPPPICRYLKITTIGRYGGSTTRTRIPIGSFYGHTFILPWEWSSHGQASAVASHPLSTATAANEDATAAATLIDQTQIFTQLNMFVSLQEDIQCRYSLACDRLVELLSAVDTPQNHNGHTQYYLRRGTKKSEDDVRIHRAYHNCMLLQLQLNLSQKAIERLKTALGISVGGGDIATGSMTALLKRSSVDKLRVLTEFLLDTLLSMTHSTPSIPHTPMSLYNVLSPHTCEVLFRNLCIVGTRKMQIHAGVLLVRVCGSHTWWGEFLGRILQDFFVSEQALIFPRDRVFVLITALGQKSLTGQSASEVIESILMLLGKLLSPLLASSQQQPRDAYYRSASMQLDLPLIGWLLLFLSKNLDVSISAAASEEVDRGKDNSGSRWDFIQGEAALANSRMSSAMRTTSAKLYRRKLQKRLMHHEHQLYALQQAKKSFSSATPGGTSSSTDKSGTVCPDVETAIKAQQEQLFNKKLKQYSSKHFKDLINIRRTDGEILRKLPSKDSSSVGSEKSHPEDELETSITISRDKCLPVVRGLISLLLSMDFTCNVDLFIIACKVAARIMNLTRPAISLSEVMTTEELERLVLLSCDLNYNHGNITWGGSWAGHVITCLLQDILDGERLYPASACSDGGLTDDEAGGASASETDESMHIALSTIDEDSSVTPEALEMADESPQNGDAAVAKNNSGFKFDKESIVNMILEDEIYGDMSNPKLDGFLSGEPGYAGFKSGEMPMSNAYVFQHPINALAMQTMASDSGTVSWGPPKGYVKKGTFDSWKNKIANFASGKGPPMPQGVSTAMDARLENGVQLIADLRLKVMLSMESEIVQTVISAPLPVPLPGVVQQSYRHQGYHQVATDDEQLSQASFLSSMAQYEMAPSSSMLSTCFDHLFGQLAVPQQRRINMEALLSTWLMLNDNVAQSENGAPLFDASRVPSIPLSETSVGALLVALAWQPVVSVRLWVLALQTLTLLANIKCPGDGEATSSGERWLARAILADSNLSAVLVNFLSFGSVQGPGGSHNSAQVGPTATRALQEFLLRLQLRCCAEGRENDLKELLLKLIYTLTAERGSFYSALGPMDAQCRLLDFMLEQNFESVDVNNALSVIESISFLVHRHIVSQERLVCHNVVESGMSARTCFSGLFSSMLRPVAGDSSKSSGGEVNRNQLMSSLLKLVNVLVQVPISSMHRTTVPPSGMDFFPDFSASNTSSDNPMTDTSKMAASAMSPTAAILHQQRDDHVGSATDEQKTETAANAASTPGGAAMQPPPRMCSHFSNCHNPDDELKTPTLANVILAHQQIMMHLVESLSCCNSNTMAMILGSSGLQGSMQDLFTGSDPLSVGDGIFHVLCTINRSTSDIRLILKAVYDYLTCSIHRPLGALSGGGDCISQLSEPLLWFLLQVLDCKSSIEIFLEMGGVETVCRNLVYSNRRLVNTSPSLISTMMQHLSSAKTPSGGSSSSRGKSSTESENTDGMQNFSPLGSISSSSPTSGPADVLIQALPPHRRARSAAWSYHFYPEEAWIDLTICLPCAVLLKEVQIQPHLTSLATCPSSVSVEISRDGSTTIPLSSPVQTSGLTCIKIQLLKSEVVTAVTLRLHRPRDSNTIGLSQIMLLGFTAFGDTGLMRSNSMFVPTEDYVSRTSIGWLRLLHHCLTQCEDMESMVATAAAPTPDLLVTCTALLVSPGSIIYFTNIEAVLLRIGLHSTNIGLALIDSLLRNVSATAENSGWTPLHSKVNGIANESTIDILYQLGMTVDEGTHVRVKAMAEWLGDNARVALQKSHGVTDEGYRLLQRRAIPIDLPAAAPAHVHSIAAILWQSWEKSVAYDLCDVITQDLLSSVYEWSMVLAPGSTLKKAVDFLICSLCYIRPEYFSLVLEWMGIVVSLDLSTAAITDDNKEDQQHQQGALTDDSKAEADSEARQAWAIWNDGAPAYQPTSVQDFGHMILDDLHLSTLAVVCQSPEALKQLLGSGFVAVLCQGLFEFCTREMLRCSDPLGTYPEGFTDTSKSRSGGATTGGTRPRSPRGYRSGLLDGGGARTPGISESSQSDKDKGLCITADLVAPVLKFLAEVSKELAMKDWLGSPEGSIFWPVLLSLMCVTQTMVPSGDGPSSSKQMKVMTPPQWAAIELQTVEFFRQVICCHTDNQQLFAHVLCDVIRTNSAISRGAGYSTSPLSGFMRRLFLRVLLQDEKVLVSFSSTSQLYKGQSNAMSTVIPHPRYGTGHKHRAVLVSLQSTCTEILAKVSDTPSLTAQLAEETSWEKKAAAGGSTEDAKKDIGELGLEMVDQFSLAAGLHAKEKRDKTNKGSLPRPPTRRGQRPPDTAVTSVNSIPVLALFHKLMPSQPLPGDLTLSQLLVLLLERGFSPGHASIELSINIKTRKGGKANTAGESSSIEVIPDVVLLDTLPFQSALHVFASVGGLALLAEHLPLLYPEVTRQVTPPEVTREVGSSSTGIGHDWVTLEANEDMYEDIYEPVLIPPTQTAQPATGQQGTTALPSVPPHSLVAFSLFLRLPGYAEVLLKERRHAQCLLRLVLGVTDDGEGGHILTSPVASALPTLPFTILKTLFDTTPLTTDDGVLLRRMTLEIGAVHLILACLSVLSHHGPRVPIPGFHQEIILAATQAAASLAYSNQTSTAGGSNTANGASKTIEDKGQNYWAKGTGFGTGSTTSSWDAEQALLRQRSEEEHVTCLLQVLASYINPASQLAGNFEAAAYDEEEQATHAGLPPSLPELLSQSCLVPAISSYLRNDSVLDMARHVPLYKSLLELLRGLTICPVLVPLLLPLDRHNDSSSSISTLLQKMKGCVDTYASRLKSNKVKSKSKQDDDGSEGLAELIPDIQKTAQIVDAAVGRLSDRSAEKAAEMTDAVDSVAALLHGVSPHDHSTDQLYVATMRELQFDTFEMVLEDETGLKFLMPHHYESNVKTAGDVTNASRARRLAQEAVTLSTSLPLSASSSVFVRCDEERLDVMKVMITGPCDTPYMNGCFEFDVYFPQDYPNAPPLISLETTGNHTVRFNPNLYNDGKVCLSVLNTWHGRPEEKWNSQTSSFLQVLVSIQSLILVSEPYFNEPGYERSRGTPSGTASCREYDANIRQATVKWGMLEPLKNPSVCFKEVIENHFRLKRKETMTQIEGWIAEMETYSTDKRSGRSIGHNCMALKRHYTQLKEEFAKMKLLDGETESSTEDCLESVDYNCMSTSSNMEGSTASGVNISPSGASPTKLLPECSTSNDHTTVPATGETLPLYLLSNHLSNGSDDAGYDESDTCKVALSNDVGVTTADNEHNATMVAMNGVEAPVFSVPNSVDADDASVNSAPSSKGSESKGSVTEDSPVSEQPGAPLTEVVVQGGHS